MKKVLTVCVWLGLAVCLIMLYSSGGQKNALQQELKTAQQKKETLQKQYNQSKSDWQEEKTALEQEQSILSAALNAVQEELAAVTNDLDAALRNAQIHADEEKKAQDALKQAQTDWENQLAALTAEKDAAADRLSEVLALLLPPIQEEREESPESDLFSVETPAERTPLPLLQDTTLLEQ